MSRDVQLPGVIGGPVVHCVPDLGPKVTYCGKDAETAVVPDMGVDVHKRCRQCIEADPFWSVVLGRFNA